MGNIGGCRPSRTRPRRGSTGASPASTFGPVAAILANPYLDEPDDRPLGYEHEGRLKAHRPCRPAGPGAGGRAGRGGDEIAWKPISLRDATPAEELDYWRWCGSAGTRTRCRRGGATAIAAAVAAKPGRGASSVGGGAGVDPRRRAGARRARGDAAAAAAGDRPGGVRAAVRNTADHAAQLGAGAGKRAGRRRCCWQRSRPTLGVARAARHRRSGVPGEQQAA